MWAQNWPEPTSAGAHAASACSVVVEPSRPVGQTGNPLDCSSPWRLTSMVRRVRRGGNAPRGGGRGAPAENAARPRAPPGRLLGGALGGGGKPHPPPLAHGGAR